MNANVARPDDYATEDQDWGRLIWMVSGAMGNSKTMTVGKCFIKPGCANPPHYHPNCEELLYLISGELQHSLDDTSFHLKPGDAIRVPAGAKHDARCVSASCCRVSSSRRRATLASTSTGRLARSTAAKTAWRL